MSPWHLSPRVSLKNYKNVTENYKFNKRIRCCLMLQCKHRILQKPHRFRAKSDKMKITSKNQTVNGKKADGALCHYNLRTNSVTTL